MVANLETIGPKIESQPLNNNFAALNAALEMASTAVNAGYKEDPNTTQKAYIVTNHANAPIGGVFWYIRTFFYGSLTGNRAQLAIRYDGANGLFSRYCIDGSWSSWAEFETIAGAQAKATAAETNAKNASLPRTGGAVSGSLSVAGTLTVSGIENRIRNLIVNGGYFEVESYGSQYGSGKLRTYFDANNRRWILTTNIGGTAYPLSIALNDVLILSNTGSPEGSITAPAGSIYLRIGGSAGQTFYVKVSGTGNTGWQAIA